MYEDNNKSYSITAEQAKEVELRQEKEFIVYYLRKALGMFGDMNISEAVAQLEKELEPRFEPSMLNLKLESKTVKCEELEGWTGWKVYPDSVYGRMEKFHDEHCCYCDNELCYGVYDEHGRDVCELYNEEFKADNKDGNTVYERVVTRNEDGEDEESSLELFKKLQRFWHEHCTVCGSQRCLGVYDKDWREGCKLYKEEFVSDMDTKLETNQKNEHNIAKCEYCLTVFEYNYSELEEEEDRDMRGYHYYYYAKCPKCGNRILVKSLI